MTTSDVVVIGSGVIGCAAAYHLSRAGLRVVVLDRGRLGGEASMAAAGMLAPYCEYDHRDPPQFMPFCVRGHQEHEWMAAALREEVGVDVGLRRSGFVYLRLSYQDDRAERKFAVLRQRGAPVEWISHGDLLRDEPNLSPEAVSGGILSETESVVDTLKLVEALRAAAIGRGARFIPFAGVTEARCTARGVTVRTPGETFAAARAVIAAGRGSEAVGKLFGLDLPVIPVRGQMAVTQGTGQLFRRVMYIPDGGCGSIISRPCGRLVFGTTEEYGNDGSDVTLEGIASFTRRVVRVAPLLAGLPLLRTWSGLRPCGPDRMPMLGRTHLDPVVVATGHYRNGILLGPLTGRLVKEMVMGEELTTDLAAFDPCRPHPAHEVYHDQL